MNLKAHTTQFNSNLAERRFKIDRHILKQNINQCEIRILWVDGTENTADGLKKAFVKALKLLDFFMKCGNIPVKTVFAWIGIDAR